MPKTESFHLLWTWQSAHKILIFLVYDFSCWNICKDQSVVQGEINNYHCYHHPLGTVSSSTPEHSFLFKSERYIQYIQPLICYFEKLIELMEWWGKLEKDLTLTCVDESWAGSLRRTDPGIFFRTSVTPFGFSCSFFTRLALLQPTWCSKTDEYSSLKDIVYDAEALCLSYFGAKTIYSSYWNKTYDWEDHTYTVQWSSATYCIYRLGYTHCIYCKTHHYLVVDLNHFIASQDLHEDIVWRL